MYKDKSKQREWDEAYKKENTRMLTMRFHKQHDADILAAIEKAQTMQGEIKRLVRLGIAYEKMMKEEEKDGNLRKD